MKGRQGVHLISSRLTAGHKVRASRQELRMEETCARIATGSPSGVVWAGLPARRSRDFNIEVNGVHTSLAADLDQAALYGALYRIQSFGLELVELTRISGVS